MSSVVAAAAAEGGENGSGSASASSGEDQDQGSPFSTLSGDVVEEATRVVDALRERLQRVQDEFLRIEKFANLNMMACYKILKKHDKLCPHTVCCRYYLERLHQLPWIRADHSSVFVVQMSDLFELLRGDRTRKANGKKKKASERDGAQDFVRTTRKYWVSPEDVSGVKQNIAQHLPVFLVERERVKGLVEAAAGESGDGVAPGFAGLTLPSHADSQMTNSVYLDNVHLELYHARLKKAPRAIAIRLRWYGPAPTGSVYVERKTHRESWTGEESVKERFALPAAYIVPYLQCKHTWEKEESRLRAQHAKNDRERPTSGAELKKIKTLFTEVQRAIESKQLQPTLRTVYMRTAFQVPYDASVRCSLDTSLAMLVENPAGGPSCTALERWYRDPSVPLHRTEVTRFPHAVLEIKLALGEGVGALKEPQRDPGVVLIHVGEAKVGRLGTVALRLGRDPDNVVHLVRNQLEPKVHARFAEPRHLVLHDDNVLAKELRGVAAHVVQLLRDAGRLVGVTHTPHRGALAAHQALDEARSGLAAEAVLLHGALKESGVQPGDADRLWRSKVRLPGEVPGQRLAPLPKPIRAEVDEAEHLVALQAEAHGPVKDRVVARVLGRVQQRLDDGRALRVLPREVGTRAPAKHQRRHVGNAVARRPWHGQRALVQAGVQELDLELVEERSVAQLVHKAHAVDGILVQDDEPMHL